MSSSAAFEVLIGNILSGLYNEGKISPVLIAQAGQYAENVFFGKPCGLMDQMASSVGNLIFIDFADVKNPVIKKVNVNFEDFNHSLCIVDTKGSHADLTDEYAAIPEEMKRVAAYFGKEILKQVDKMCIRDSTNFDRDCSFLCSIHSSKATGTISEEISETVVKKNCNEDYDSRLEEF